MPRVFSLATTVLGAAWAGVAWGAEKAPPPPPLPCLAELVEQARSGEGPLAFEEAFFDGPFTRVEGDDLIGRGHDLLHGFWHAEAERCFREVWRRDPESIEALLGLTLTNLDRPRRFETFLAKAEAAARGRRRLDEETGWWLKTLRTADETTRRRLMEARAATRPEESLPALWLARETILGFHRDRSGIGSRAAWDRLLAAVDAPAAATYRRLLWVNDPPPGDLPNLSPPTATSTADAWRIAGEYEKGRGRLEAALHFHIESVRSDLAWLDGRIAMPDEAQNLGANSAALALLLADLGRYEESARVARRFHRLPHHPGAAGTTQPWRRPGDTCRQANEAALGELESRAARRESIRRAVDGGELDAALAMAREARAARPRAFDAAAMEIEILWRMGDRKAALFGFDQTFRRRLAGVDEGWLAMEIFNEMSAATGMTGEKNSAPESGMLDGLVWRAPPAPMIPVKDGAGNSHALGGKHDRATLAIFFLGAGCPRCVEQLTTFLPHVEAFAEVGIDVIGISTDAPGETAVEFPIPLYSDAEARLFRACGAYDEFADRPLHGTFLIDASGAVRWREVGNAAFLDIDLLFGEWENFLKEAE